MSRRGSVAARAFLVLALMFPGLLQISARAQDAIWTGVGNDYWTNNASWSAGVPSNNPSVFITNAVSKMVTIDAATPAANLTITNLNIRSVGGATNTLLLSSNANPLNVLGTLVVGTNGSGSLAMDAGQLVTTNSGTSTTSVGLGSGGIGTMIISNNGRWLAGHVMVGDGAGSRGDLTLAGGTNVFSGNFQLGRLAVNATGTVVLADGQLVVTNNTFGSSYVGNSGLGSMTVSGGQWLGRVGYVAVTAGSVGTLNINGGTNWFSSSLTLGNGAGATGAVNVAGGTLAVTNTGGTASLVVGATGRGTLTLSGGTVIADRLFVTNGANSIFSASGGSLAVRTATIGGAFSFTNTTATISSNLTVTSAGSLSGTNGTFVLFGDFINQSTNRASFDLSRSTVLFTNGAGATTHILNLTNSGAMDLGAAGMNAVQLATNFSIGTLSIASNNNLIVSGSKSGALTNALYVGWLDLSAWNTNAASLNGTLLAALTLTNINLYYDMGDSRNAYLQSASYNLWGAGLLIPIPEPSAMMLALTAGAFFVFMLRWKGGWV